MNSGTSRMRCSQKSMGNFAFSTAIFYCHLTGSHHLLWNRPKVWVIYPKSHPLTKNRVLTRTKILRHRFLLSDSPWVSLNWSSQRILKGPKRTGASNKPVAERCSTRTRHVPDCLAYSTVLCYKMATLLSLVNEMNKDTIRDTLVCWLITDT